MLGQEFLDPGRPLNQADAIPIKAVLIADLIHLTDVPDAVYVKMIQRETSVLIFL